MNQTVCDKKTFAHETHEKSMCICRLEYKRPYYCYFGIRSCFFFNFEYTICLCVTAELNDSSGEVVYIHIISIVFPHNMVIKFNLIFQKKKKL